MNVSLPAAASYAAFVVMLVVVSAVDIRTHTIPNRLVAAGILLLAASVAARALPLGQSLAGMAAAGGLMFLVALLGRGAMGMGDVKVSLVIGGFLGWPRVLTAMFFSFILVAVAGLLLLALRVKGRKDFIPFGPFLAAGALLGLILGNRVLAWYLARWIRG
ncbi:MAG: prepilin peptidase [Firmicutes bacterium]|nr:prepilin peptidase [Bacillota bacterium]